MGRSIAFTISRRAPRQTAESQRTLELAANFQVMIRNRLLFLGFCRLWFVQLPTNRFPSAAAKTESCWGSPGVPRKVAKDSTATLEQLLEAVILPGIVVYGSTETSLLSYPNPTSAPIVDARSTGSEEHGAYSRMKDARPPPAIKIILW